MSGMCILVSTKLPMFSCTKSGSELGKTKELIVITGSIIPNNSKSIGSGVKIPTHFYKVIYDKKTKETICFLIPNKSSEQDLGKFKIQLMELENTTKIDFK